MKRALKTMNPGLLRAVAVSLAVLVTASCQNDQTLAAGGSSSESLLSIPSSVSIPRALTNSLLTSSLKVNGQAVDSAISINSSGYSVSASLETAILFQGTGNNLDLSIKYPCGQNGDEIELIGVARDFSYSGSGITISATSDREPDSDRDNLSNLVECEGDSLAYDPNSPVAIVDDSPSTGSASFTIGIADNRFYDTDTNDSQYLRLDGAIQELNDNFSQAKAIGTNAETTGYVSSVSDEDDYYFVTGSGSGFVSLVSASSSANLDLYIYNNDGSFAFSSTNAGSAVESLNDLFLPFYIRVNGESGGGSLYKLVTAVGSQITTRSTAVARFRLSLIDPATNVTLSEDGKYDSTFIVNGNLASTQVVLSDVPAGNYNYRIHSDVNEDDGNFDSFYDMGVAASGSIVVSAGGQVSTTITLE